MDNTLTQLGIGAVLAITVIRMVLDFLKSKKNGHSSGTLDPAEWEIRIRRIVQEELVSEFASRNESIRRMLREEIQSIVFQRRNR